MLFQFMHRFFVLRRLSAVLGQRRACQADKKRKALKKKAELEQKAEPELFEL
jgi:hypothetical protein